MVKIGYLGPQGTFSHVAVKEYCRRNGLSEKAEGPCVMPIDHVFSLLSSIDDQGCDRIIVPVENSIEGNVNITLDQLIKSDGLFINEEIVIPISSCLLIKKETDPEKITDVLSHSQPLAQCHRFILDRPWQSRVTSSTASAARFVSNGKYPYDDNNTHVEAVIGSELLEQYWPDLKVIKKDIQDNKNNQTRFVVISKAPSEPTGSDKTSIVFSAKKDEPGSLHKILKEFASNQINLTRITSRPTKDVLGEYLFFIDCDGHSNEEPLLEVLNIIEEKSSFFKMLGSYKKDEK